MVADRIDSYDPDARLPKPGTRWVWEIDKPWARELIEVAGSFWNGEEWWVKTIRLGETHLPAGERREDLNDLSRCWEAVTPVGGPLTARCWEQRRPDEERD